MQQESINLKEFMERFQTAEDCQAHFFNIKWPNGFVFPKCGENQYHHVKTRNIFECKICGAQTSLTAGTIMHRSHTPLKDWFIAIFLFTSDKRGFSAMQLKAAIGCSYPTAWLIFHKIRKAMSDKDSGYILRGIVEMDDAFFGAPTEGGKRGRGTDKTPAIISLQLNTQGHPEYVKVEVVETVNAVTIQQIAEKAVEPGTKIVTDGLNSYEKLGDVGYEHQGEVFSSEVF